ncbi:cold shock domain-containing protein [Chryseobacterium sp. MEBOG06]|uniref:cold shock domain-containing protein n=1 Tax=unclassified Chryseobacterium TaxID=2593645 RepID=UPI001F3DDE07|nr:MULTISPECIES: cold shock domain-containing protein [unclassified Chryseobacterium]UKB85187.1 cold shock domain-containing protein [Chryseobacterium sp. MEBOG06]
MADSFSKKENFKKKIQKQKEKALRREERKTNNNKGMDDVFMYVDEFGRLTSTPPEQRQEVNIEEIQLGAAPIIDEDPRKLGIITFHSEKGYGFITEDVTKENIFFHNNNCAEMVKKGNKVSFEKEKSPKGFSAVNIQIVK